MKMSNDYLTAIIVEELIPAITVLKDEIVELKKEMKELKKVEDLVKGD